ncbi:MAG: hypothetical protein EA424_06995 [Planctomycetaceae bacterium]|nr:MAG: hypothetical protein EA424_06995 [Planctomycetaceae bacterium]
MLIQTGFLVTQNIMVATIVLSSPINDKTVMSIFVEQRRKAMSVACHNANQLLQYKRSAMPTGSAQAFRWVVISLELTIM